MKLRIDYNNVLRRAQEISNVIQVLNARRNDLLQTSNNLHAAWEGEAASTFQAKLDELIKELDASIKEMSVILRDILTIADSIKKEDERLAAEKGGLGAGGGGGGGR